MNDTSLHEFYFMSIIKIQPKIASHLLLTHRRGAHRNFLDDLFLFQKSETPFLDDVVKQRVKFYLFPC